MLNKGLYQRSKIFALRHGQKRSMQGLYSGAYKTFGLAFAHITVNVLHLIFYFIKCSFGLLLIDFKVKESRNRPGFQEV